MILFPVCFVFSLLFITTAFNFILIYYTLLRSEALCLFTYLFSFFVQKMFNSVNEYNLSEQHLSGCQSMIAWFSDVNEMDTKKNHVSHLSLTGTLYSGYIYC